MNIRDCEILLLAPRGHDAAVIVGPRRLAEHELADLLSQHSQAGSSASCRPAYWSPDGWQIAAITASAAQPPSSPAPAAKAPSKPPSSPAPAAKAPSKRGARAASRGG